MICPNCQTSLPDEARFCFHCGAAQPPPPEETTPAEAPVIDWQQALGPQLETLFSDLLEERIARIGSPDRLHDYREKLYRSGFRDTVHHRIQQLTDEMEREQLAPNFSPTRSLSYLQNVLRDLADFFLLRYTNDLHPHPLPESILRHQQARWATVDLNQLVYDYLALDQEAVTYYTDLLKMPREKLRNAGRHWLFPARDERILLLVDLSLFGQVKEGFALTEEAIYWKAPLQPAQAFSYRDLKTIEREHDWLLLNGHFFNAAPRLNTKILLLLEKLAQIAE